jgi:hypothetical protein
MNQELVKMGSESAYTTPPSHLSMYLNLLMQKGGGHPKGGPHRHTYQADAHTPNPGAGQKAQVPVIQIWKCLGKTSPHNPTPHRGAGEKSK